MKITEKDLLRARNKDLVRGGGHGRDTRIDDGGRTHLVCHHAGRFMLAKATGGDIFEPYAEKKDKYDGDDKYNASQKETSVRAMDRSGVATVSHG